MFPYEGALEEAKEKFLEKLTETFGEKGFKLLSFEEDLQGEFDLSENILDESLDKKILN